jgi:hypothetical protein
MNVQCYLIIRVHGKYWNGINVLIFWIEPCWKNGLNINFVDDFNYKHVYFSWFYELVSWKISIVDYVQLNLFQLYDILNIGQKNHVIWHLIMFSYMGNVFWNILCYKHEYHT